MYEFLSTFAHVISFPFWFFALILIGGPLTNNLTLEFGRVKRLATTTERWQFGAIGVLCLAIAIFLVTR